LADRLVKRGDEVEVWTFRHPPALPEREIVGGVTVRRFDFAMPSSHPRSLAAFPASGIRSYTALSAAVRDFRPDVLHVQCFSGQGIYAAAVGTRHRVPLVVTLQGETVMDDADIYDRSTALRLGLRGALRRARAVTGCSQFVIDDAVARFGLPPNKGQVIHNGVEIAGDETPFPLDLPFERYVLGLGRVVPKKGFDLLLSAFATVAEGHPTVGLVIGGDGSARRDLIRQAAELGVADRVVLPGRLDRAQVAWAMANAEVFALPSRVEPFGIVVIEALRAGRPVVVSARGGAPEIIRDSQEGLVADPFDTAEFSAAIDLLLRDSNLAARLARAGRARVEDFSWDAIAGRYAEVYRAVR